VGCGYGGIAFARQCGGADLFVGKILFCGVAFELARAAVLEAVVEGFQVGLWN
jgi:hypothetical protein